MPADLFFVVSLAVAGVLAFEFIRFGVSRVLVWQWLLVAPPLFILGALAALGSFDFDFGNGMIHYAFYVLIVVVLRMVGGMPSLWDTTV